MFIILKELLICQMLPWQMYRHWHKAKQNSHIIVLALSGSVGMMFIIRHSEVEKNISNRNEKSLVIVVFCFMRLFFKY